MNRADESYAKVKAKAEEMEDLKEKMEEAKREYWELKYAYRRESVNRVLDFIRTEYRAGRVCDLETLLCHCQNKLNGNIDGVELKLEESYKGVEVGKEALRRKGL